MKNDNAYTTMVNTYREMGIDSVDKAYKEKSYIQRKAMKFSLVSLGILILLVILFPKLSIFWFMAGALINTWVWMSARYGFRFIDRYIVEELKNK